MVKDTRDAALDTIQDIADRLATYYDLPADVCEYLRIIEALARHRDLANPLAPTDMDLLRKLRNKHQ
jgi:hypothetical protein